jgi:hypothetical protein
MPRKRNIKVFMDENFEDSNDQSSEQVRFDLYRRQKEIQEVAKVLKGLYSKGKTEQAEWLKENESFVSELAENFIDESLFKLDGIKLDNKTLQLSVEVMTQLRETMGLFQAIISGEEDLEA